MATRNPDYGYLLKFQVLLFFMAIILCISFVDGSLTKNANLVPLDQGTIGDSVAGSGDSLNGAPVNPTWTNRSLVNNSASGIDGKLKQSETGEALISQADLFNEQFSGVVLSERIDEMESRLNDALTKIDELILTVENLQKMNENLSGQIKNLTKSNDVMKEQLNQVEIKFSDPENTGSSTTAIGTGLTGLESDSTSAATETSSVHP